MNRVSLIGHVIVESVEQTERSLPSSTCRSVPHARSRAEHSGSVVRSRSHTALGRARSIARSWWGGRWRWWLATPVLGHPRASRCGAGSLVPKRRAWRRGRDGCSTVGPTHTGRVVTRCAVARVVLEPAHLARPRAVLVRQGKRDTLGVGVAGTAASIDGAPDNSSD